MRLIDADAVRKMAVPHTRGDHGYSADIRKWAVLVGDIDDAPTVDAPSVPCKIGDTVYGLRNYRGVERIQSGTVSEMFFTKNMRLVVVVKHVCRGYWTEKVFPTYEAAAQGIRLAGEIGGKE